MYDIFWYSVAVFMIVFLSACVLNLLENHHVFQLTGIAFFFTFFIFRSLYLFKANPTILLISWFQASLPLFAGISACMCSMVLGFLIFPWVRSRFRD
jgi:hypothetical protein